MKPRYVMAPNPNHCLMCGRFIKWDVTDHCEKCIEILDKEYKKQFETMCDSCGLECKSKLCLRKHKDKWHYSE